ncbi:hypothetical protein IAI10_13880 [Clostridium sp. 19966]|nr:hypothetical protein [Clostridium sp. 19966]
MKDLTIYMPVMLAATTSMRLVQICGLRWSDVDLDMDIFSLKISSKKKIH